MQTREMKREYEVAVLDPAGNVTAIVLSDVLAAERARIAAQLLRLPELRIEQAAFLTATWKSAASARRKSIRILRKTFMRWLQLRA